jgi:hypothetical protein
MSGSALLKSVRNLVRNEMQLDEQTCAIMPGPLPPPSCGQRFLSIYLSEWRPGDRDLNRGIDEYFSVTLTWSYRVAYLPADAHGEEAYIQQLEGIEAASRLLIPLLHQNIEVMSGANNLILDGEYKFIEPLRWQGGDPVPKYVGAAWFGSGEAQSKSGPEDNKVGLVQEVTFGEARRIQPLTADYRPN